MEFSKVTTTTTELSIATTTTTKLSRMPSDVFILVITNLVDQSYLQSGDGTSKISATINAPDKHYARNAAYALVNGELHIFGGLYDYKKYDSMKNEDLVTRRCRSKTEKKL
ncbi:unnamed protein product [Oikopleura dioica]|uniref:Uncharacterized protein n=1 Tax=Oikopleura dioica TaxID=34765 RepID=E4XMF1_OIKDI|nr:unnamed protein product [Oikopleura dioica]